MGKKLIYILSSYGKNESSHFSHIPRLLDEMSNNEIDVTVLILKGDALPEFRNKKIDAILIKNGNIVSKYVALFMRLRTLIKSGYRKTFVRISASGSIIASLAHRIYGGESYLWQSGTTLEFDMGQKLSISKIRWFIFSYIPSMTARKMVHYFVTGPRFMVKYYAKNVHIPETKIKMLYNDIDVNRFKPPSGSEKKYLKSDFLLSRGYDENLLILLMVHRLSPVRKTPLYFPGCLLHLKGKKLLSKVLAVVAGDGDDLRLVRRQAENDGVADRCVFLGKVPNDEIERLYAIADIFLHPTYNEGFPRVILEAMAAGLPIVSTDAGGTIELLGKRQRGYVFSRECPEKFAEGLESLVLDEGEREKLRSENLDEVLKFSTDRIARMYEEVLFS